jgi:MinD-like ATPase involved in chromosome partitioning or flagellar assembly
MFWPDMAGANTRADTARFYRRSGKDDFIVLTEPAMQTMMDAAHRS